MARRRAGQGEGGNPRETGGRAAAASGKQRVKQGGRPKVKTTAAVGKVGPSSLWVNSCGSNCGQPSTPGEGSNGAPNAMVEEVGEQSDVGTPDEDGRRAAEQTTFCSPEAARVGEKSVSMHYDDGTYDQFTSELRKRKPTRTAAREARVLTSEVSALVRHRCNYPTPDGGGSMFSGSFVKQRAGPVQSCVGITNDSEQTVARTHRRGVCPTVHS